MKFLSIIAGIALLFDAAAGNPGGPLRTTASRGVSARDPSTIVKCGNTYWIFYTGKGIRSFWSKDLVKWNPGPPVFDKAPEWIASEVPNNRDMIFWAPDVAKVGDEYRLYYSVSSMGSINSAIGLATTPTLDPKDRDFGWKDRGLVVRSKKGGDFNAIDPSLFQDDDGTMWLVFGSYWSGIKLIQLDPKTGKRISPDSPQYSLAYNSSIEASYLYKHDGWYYLFVNWDSCCQGEKSTYNIRVGRSRTITGPYIDKDGRSLLHGNGSLFLANRNGPLIAPGHAGILVDKGRSWLSCHFEADLRMKRPALGVMPMHWGADGWPVAELPDK